MSYRHYFATAVLLVLLAGCGHSESSDAVQMGSAANEDQSAAEPRDPCGLLPQKDVESALGAGLAVPPYRAPLNGPPQADGEDCVYETADFHRIVLEPTWTGGPSTLRMYGMAQGMVDQKMKGALSLGQGATVAGDWDEAKITGCCTLLVLLGDTMISIDIGSSNASLEQAATLANTALGHLGKPLGIDGAKAVPAALALEAKRPARVDPCSLVSRTEVEALLGPLSVAPVSEADSCSYELPAQGVLRQLYELKIQWHGGYANYRQNNAMAGSIFKAMLPSDKEVQRTVSDGRDGVHAKASIDKGSSGSDTGAQKMLAGVDAGQGPWDEATTSILGFTAVRKDVQMTIDVRGVNADNARKLVALAMSKIH